VSKDLSHILYIYMDYILHTLTFIDILRTQSKLFILLTGCMCLCFCVDGSARDIIGVLIYCDSVCMFCVYVFFVSVWMGLRVI
jgi:hypothetical protein